MHDAIQCLPGVEQVTATSTWTGIRKQQEAQQQVKVAGKKGEGVQGGVSLWSRELGKQGSVVLTWSMNSTGRLVVSC